MNLVEFAHELPRYTLIGGDRLQSERINSALGSTDWQQSSDTEPKLVNTDLVLLDSSAQKMSGSASLLPQIALFAGANPPIDCDELFDRNLSDSEIRIAIDRWRPTPDAQVFARVAGEFGAEALRPVAHGLADQLAAAIAGLDDGNLAHAHRIAGLAGTLGFKRVSRAWIAIDEGDLRDLGTARRESRLAQAALARWLAD